MIIGKWGAYCEKHRLKKSPGGKGIAVYGEPEKSEAELNFLKDLE